MKSKESIKFIIKQVKREIKNEFNIKKKNRLNKYKQKLEVELRDLTRNINMGGEKNV